MTEQNDNPQLDSLTWLMTYKGKRYGLTIEGQIEESTVKAFVTNIMETFEEIQDA